MSAEKLLSCGLRPVGTVQILDGRFTISLSTPEAADFERCLYAFLVGNEIMRIGSSKGKLRLRIRAWEADVSHGLAGDYSRTRQSEAEIWRTTLLEYGTGHLYARLGTVVTTPVGEFNLYQIEERALIEKHKPRCCNDVTRIRNP